MVIPRILIGGLSGGGGKTLLSVGTVAAWRRQGRVVAPFKKGPDYIDAAWLGRAAGQPCRNLDMFLMDKATVAGSFAAWAGRADVGVIEGNRGLFDGADSQGTFSTAELAKMLDAPVLLVLNCTKCTRTAAALVLGCQRLDPDLALRGVILNQTGGARHEAVLRESIEDACGIPVLGAIPRLDSHPFPERHLGLVPPDEHGNIDDAVERAADVAERYLDLEGIGRLAWSAPPFTTPLRPGRHHQAPPPTVRIGVFRDAAFQFYYPENLEALEREGAALVPISPLDDAELPEVDALYIGGGFPETLAGRLADNRSFRASVRRTVREGLPVYAECGGAVYLGEKLHMGGGHFAMSAAVPAVFGFGDRPDGHGYAVVETVKPNPFFAVGETLRGHEFHYTFLQSVIAEEVTFAFRVQRGRGFGSHRDGLCYRNVLASYTHVHALGVEGWAPALVRAAVDHRWRSGDPARTAS